MAKKTAANRKPRAKDAAALLVEADLLQAKADPLGEFFALSHALAAKPGDAKLLAAEARLLETHSALHRPAAVERIRAARLAFAAKVPDGVRYRYEHIFGGWHDISGAVDDVKTVDRKVAVSSFRAGKRVIPIGQLLYRDEAERDAGIPDLRDWIVLHHAHWTVEDVDLGRDGWTARIDWAAIVEVSVKLTGPLAGNSAGDQELQDAVRSQLSLLEPKWPDAYLSDGTPVSCNTWERFDDELTRVQVR